MLSTDICVPVSRIAWLAPMQCGVRITRSGSRSRIGLPAFRGSCSKTSSAAPAIQPVLIARHNAASSTTGPRELLTR